MILTTKGLKAIQTSGYADFDVLLVGTGTQTEDESLTALATELDSTNVSVQVVTDATLYLQGVFTNSEAVGTITEIGVEDSDGNLLLYGALAVDDQVEKPNSRLWQVGITDALANASSS